MTIEKKVKAIYRLHKVVFDRGNSILESVNKFTLKYGLCQVVLSDLVQWMKIVLPFVT